MQEAIDDIVTTLCDRNLLDEPVIFEDLLFYQPKDRANGTLELVGPTVDDACVLD